MALYPWATPIQAALETFFSFVPHLIPKWIRDASNKRHIHNVTIEIEKQPFEEEGENNPRFNIFTVFQHST